MATAYWAGGTSTDTNTAANWVDSANGTNPFGSVPGSADDVIIQSTSNSNVDRNPTQNAAHTFNSFKLESGAQWTADGTNHLTLDGEDANDFAIRITDGTFVHSNGSVVINNGGGGIAHAAIQAGTATSTNGFYDLTISGGGTTCEIYGTTTIQRNMEAGGATTVLRGDLTVNGNLTVYGALTTIYSSTSYNLTVTGKTIVGDGSSAANTATLTCNASTISLGASYTADYALRVKRGGTFVGGSGQHTFGSFSNEDHADSITTLTTHANGTTLSSEYSSAGPNGYALAVYDDSTFDDADGLVVYTGPSADSYLSGKTLHNVTINTAGNTIGMQNAHTFNGNLTITAGTLNTRPASTTENNALTVTGTTTVGPASGVADQATLTCNASTVSLGALRQQADYALNIETGGTFVGGSGEHTFGSLYMSQSANAKATMTSNTCKINGKNTSANKSFRVEYGGDTFDNANGTITFQFNGFDSRLSMRSEGHANNAFHNLIINMNGDTRTISIDNGTDVKVDNDLTVSRGIFNVGSNHNLEVVGDANVGSSSEVSNLKFSSSSTKTAKFGSLVIGADGTYEATQGITELTDGSGAGTWILQNGGTFTHNDGTVKVTSTESTCHVQAYYFYNLTIAMGDSTDITKFRDGGLPAGTSGEITIANDLIIEEGELRRDNLSDKLIVTGDVTVQSGGTLGHADETGNNTFGSLTIDSGGIHIATEGTTTIIDGNFDNSGTFTHNDGKVTFQVHDKYINNSGTVEPVFYDLEVGESPTVGAGDLQLVDSKNITIARHLTTVDTGRLRPASMTITMGTTSASGDIITATEDDIVMRSNSDTPIFTAASSFHPIEIKTRNPFNFGIKTGENWQFKWVDFQVALDTDTGGSNATTITLTGDCEFDAVTVASGDTLDINGQRAEFSGDFTSTGNVNGGGLIFAGGDYNDGNGSGNSFTTKTLVMDGGYCNASQTTWQNIFLRNGTHTIGGARTWTNTPLFLGGTANFTSNNTWGNINIATGGDFDGNAATITCSGDWTSSGGLLGASAITLDGGSPASKYVSCNATVLNGATTFTIEAWIKPDVNNLGFQTIVCARDGGNDGVALSMLNQTIRLRIGDGGSDDLVTDNVITTAGKWYHVVGLRDSSNNTKIYVDGKLVKQGTSSKSISISQDLKIGVQSYDNNNGFDGSIDEVRIFNDERTQTEIRDNMFSEITSVGSDLILYAKFNEGTGNPVDSGTNTRTLTATGDIWAGAGTFTYDTSTLKMTGTGGKKINYRGDLSVNKLTIATGGDAHTITLNDIDGNNSGVVVYHTLEQESGKLASTTSESIQIGRTFGNILVASGKGATAFADVYRFYIFQNSQTGTMNFPSASSADKDLTLKRLWCTSDSTITVVSGGDLTITEGIKIDYNNSFQATGTTTAKNFNLSNNGNLNLGGNTLVLSDASEGFYSATNTSINAGPGCTISGSSAATGFQSQNNFIVVGNISNLNVTNEELKVTGMVTDCTGLIHQMNPSQDADQQLDKDTADDRDVGFASLNLDRNTELVG